MEDGRVLLLWRDRFITGTWGWLIPVGKIDPGEDPAQAAAHETEEETGWRPGPLSPLLRAEPTPGISDSDVPALISRGEISTGTTLAALLFALARQRPEN